MVCRLKRAITLDGVAVGFGVVVVVALILSTSPLTLISSQPNFS